MAFITEPTGYYKVVWQEKNATYSMYKEAPEGDGAETIRAVR